MKKKIITFLSIFAISTSVCFAAPSTVKVIVNNKQLITDTDAVIRNNRTMVPFRALFEALGAKNISWDEPTQSVTGSDGTTTIKLVIGSYDIEVNGKITTMDTPPMIINSRTMIPLSAVSNAMGAKVVWNGKDYIANVTKSINISSNNDIFPISTDVANNINDSISNTVINNNTKEIPPKTTDNNTFNNIDTSTTSNSEIQGYYAMEDLKRNKYVLNLKSDGTSEIINISTLAKTNGTYSYTTGKLSMNISSFTSSYDREDVDYAGSKLILMKDVKSPTSGSTFVLLKTTEEEYKKYIK